MAEFKEKDNAHVHHDERSPRRKIDNLVDDDGDGYAPSLAGSMQDAEVKPIVGIRPWLVVSACAMGYAAMLWGLVAIGLQRTSVVATVGGADDSIWIQNSNTLVAVVLGIILARVSDLVGRKWIAVCSLLCGTLGFAIIGGATSMNMAIAGGAVSGIALSMQGILAAIASEVLPRRSRSWAQMAFNFGPTTGGILGSVAGQKIAGYTSIAGVPGWRWDFYAAALMCFLAASWLAIVYHPPPTPNPAGRSYLDRWLDFDRGGTALFIIAIVPLLLGLTWGGGAYPWNSAHAIAPTVVGGVLFFVFIAYETFIKKDGLAHHGLFSINRNFALSLIANFVEGIFYFPYNAFYGEQNGILYEPDPLLLGLRFSAFFYPTYIGYFLAAWYVRVRREVRGPLIFGYVLFIGIMIGLSQLTTNSASSKGIIVAGVMAGFAFSPAEALLQLVAQLAVPPPLIATASGLGASTRSFGGVIGVAIFNAIFNSKVTSSVPAYVAPAVLAAGLPETSLVPFITQLATLDVAPLAAIPGVTPEIIGVGFAAIQQAFAYSFSFIWYAQIPFLVLALVSVVFLKSIRDQMTWIINRPLEAIHHTNHLGQRVHHDGTVVAEEPQRAGSENSGEKPVSSA